MIVFGWNSFEQDSYIPSSLGLPQNLDAQYKIIKRQKYFHIFWIPFFSIGSDFILKSPDNKLYEPNPELNIYLNSIGLKFKTPWFSFIGLILLVIGFIIYTIIDTLQTKSSIQKSAEMNIKNRNENVEKINNAKLGHYFTLMDKEYRNSYLKVIDADKYNIRCLLSYKKNINSAPKAFISDSTYPSFDTVTVSKQNLIKSLSQITEIIKNGPLRELSEITYFYEPKFISESGFYKNGKFIYLVKNEGIPVRFISLSQLDRGNTTIIDEQAIDKNQNKGIFNFQGFYNDNSEPDNTSLIQFQNERGDKYIYKISIKGNNISFFKK